MTISSESIQAGPFAGDGVTTVRAFAFKTLNQTDLEVVSTSAAGVDTTLTLTTHYTVSLNADQDNNPGGTITEVTASATGVTLNIYNRPDFTQLIDLISNGAWNPQVVEGALDRLTILSKRARDRTGLDWRGDWATALSYLFGNIVKQSGNIYFCLVDHTSGTFATDLAAANWVKWVEDGAVGPAGAAGADGIAGGLFYAFDSSTTTNADPGSGDIRLNHATLASVTEIAISDTTDDTSAPDVGAWIGTWANSNATVRGYIMIKQIADASNVAIYSITAAAVDGTTYWRFTVSHISSAGSFADTDAVSIEFVSEYIGLVLGTPVATTSGTTADFTGIPSGTKQIFINFNGTELDGTDNLHILLGDSGGFETTGYTSSSTRVTAAPPNNQSSTSAIIVGLTGGNTPCYGVVILKLTDSATNTWVSSHNAARGTNTTWSGAGIKSLSSELTQIRIQPSGADNFAGGAINIQYQ